MTEHLLPAATPLRGIPAWAVLERRLFDVVEQAWREFSSRYCEPDGRLRFGRRMVGRDGVDDFYEAFFNWPAFYLLGGSDDILAAAKHHWRGVTAQLSEYGMLADEFEVGYDWYHQGESLLFFYGLCAADPADDQFADRARRFARLYTDDRSGNYDAATNTIGSPHNGAKGLRHGLDPGWESYSSALTSMRPYGLPLEFVPGVREWADLDRPEAARALGAEMQRTLGRGDVAVNLGATSLVANRWLYDGDADSARWIERYVTGWRDRAAANGGLIPDNVDPSGVVGGLHDGRWFGGHYGWTWPHGLPSVGMAALIGAMNASTVTGDASFYDLARVPLDTVIEHGVTASVQDTPMSLRAGWLDRLGADARKDALLVPHRYGRDGWFDFGPMPMSLPTWLWWLTRDPADWQRLRTVVDASPEDPAEVKHFRDKEEAGHEIPWLSYLAGENPEYPVQGLSMALGQVARRAALMERERPDPSTMHIHFWQRVNPVVTEVLTQLIAGAPQVLYNGGLPRAAVRYGDADRARPGLPPQVAALVTGLGHDQLSLELVNLDPSATRRVHVYPGSFGEEDIASATFATETPVDYPGPATAYAARAGVPGRHTVEVNAPRVLIELPPSHQARLTLTLRPSGRAARHPSTVS